MITPKCRKFFQGEGNHTPWRACPTRRCSGRGKPSRKGPIADFLSTGQEGGEHGEFLEHF